MTLTQVVAVITGAAAVCGAITTIFIFTRRIVNYFRKRDEKLDNITKSLDILTRHDLEQYLSILRLTIMNDNIPLSERIIAGDKYVRLGGNGDVKHYYEEMLLENHIK